MTDATHPAGNFCATRSIGGYADWYLPAKDELYTMYVNKGSMPAGQGFGIRYWSSTETNSECACDQCFSLGSISRTVKTGTSNCVRAVRRSPI
jgi:hypothetical protein